MNQELLQFYIQGLANDWFMPASNTGMAFPDDIENVMTQLEYDLGRKRSAERKLNPEFQVALKVVKSPLMKALK